MAATTTTETKKPAFTKEQIVASKKYRSNRDLLNVILDEGKKYTAAEIDKKIEDFKKGKVK